MRLWAVLVLVGCGSQATPATPPALVPTPAPIRPPPPSAPVVDHDRALLPVDEGAPPIVVIIDAEGRRTVAAAKSWQDIAAGTFASGPKPARAEGLLRALRQTWRYEEKTSPVAIVDALEKLEPTTASPPDGGPDMHWGFSARKGELPIERDPEDPHPTRQTRIIGQIADPLERQPAVVLAAPSTKAARVVEAIVESQGMIGVVHRGAIRRLRFQFTSVPVVSWQKLTEIGVEILVASSGLQVGVYPEPPVAFTTSSDPSFKTTVTDAEKRAPRQVQGLVDVLVAADADVQRLVDVLVALDDAGVRWVGLGMAPAPDSEEGRMRRDRIKSVGFGEISMTGELDKAVIRDAFKRQRPAFLACFEKVASKPELRGRMYTQFFISPKGIVVSASASGIDPTLETCVKNVISKLEFPAPPNGYGVQVGYPLVFRQ